MVRGIYVHIPFCSYKCPYCDFLSVTDLPVEPEDYVDLVVEEAKMYSHLKCKLETLYIGGGTPTILEPALIVKLIENISEVFGVLGWKEITVECNPETYNYYDFIRLREGGVNRLSVGVQTFSKHGLRALGRKHSVADSIATLENAMSAGFSNINVDLIYGYPDHKAAHMELDLRCVEELKPQHVSAYMLTVYENTKFSVYHRNGLVSLPCEDEIREIYEVLCNGLSSAGYRRYEISNWALNGHECVHNLMYWNMEEFVGLGVSSWGFVNRIRYANTKNVREYALKISNGRKPVRSVYHVDEEEWLKEFVMLRLRLVEGVPPWLRLNIPDRLVPFLDVEKDHVRIKEEYMILANEITSELLVYNSCMASNFPEV